VRTAALALLTFAVVSLSGCSSGHSPSKIQVGTITFTDVNGNPEKTPSTSLTVGQGAYVDVTLTNDSQLLGADWSVVCGSAPLPGTPLPPGQTQDQSCGSFTPAHTMSGPIPGYVTTGTRYVALYTAPAVPPKQGVVTLYAAATSDHSRFATVTLTIGGQPISVGFAPPPPSTLQVGADTQIRAALNNDATNMGVTWSVICGSSACGSFGPVQTTSGVATTYVAPSLVPTGGTVQVTATSIADPTKAVSATITITKVGMGMATGSVRSGLQPVSGAQVTLYEAVTSATAQNVSTNTNNASAVTTVMTDQDGNFLIPYGYQCPAPDTQMYLVADGGNAGGGVNPNLALMAALGPCSSIDASSTVVNEVTTVAAVYALNGFIIDAQHVGSSKVSPVAMSSAFASARDLVDAGTGVARSRTVSGKGITPQTKINTLANLLNACARTAGATQGDGSDCDRLFRATNPSAKPATQANDTLQALVDLARNATGVPGREDSFATLDQLSASTSSFGPALSGANDWLLSVQFPNGSGSEKVGTAKEQMAGAPATNLTTDPSGTLWIQGNGYAETEYVGAASCAGAMKTLTSSAASSGNAAQMPGGDQ